MTREDVIEILARFVIGAKPCSQREIIDACASAYGMLKEQPSLHSNLDEAAQKVEDYYDVGDEHGYLCCRRGDIKDAFKAGAEWMAEQGYVKEGITRPDDCEIWVNMTNTDIKDGDEVIVQIRKK